MLGATGTIGQATVRALVARGHEVVCFVRPRAGVGGQLQAADMARLFSGAVVRVGDVQDPVSLARDGFQGERFDALVSCLASRTGVPKDAWAIDHQAHVHALGIARQAGVSQVVLLSAICVQKPLLAFQQAKLAFEQVLIESGLTYSIVRPTAFFKSLSGQIRPSWHASVATTPPNPCWCSTPPPSFMTRRPHRPPAARRCLIFMPTW